MLAHDVRGAGPRLVLVHGFTQTRACWGPVADDLASDHELVLIDAPGHGGSSSVAAGIEDGAALLTAAGGRATYLGYSMGGRYALRAALDHPDQVERLILVGASPGIDDPQARASRRRADEALADRLETIGLDAFLDEWLALPLFAGLPPDRRFLAERRRNEAGASATSLRIAGTGAQEPVWDRLAQLTMPVVLAAGEHDDKFRAIADDMAARIGPQATVAVIPGAGHTAHLENVTAFTATVRRTTAPRRPTAPDR